MCQCVIGWTSVHLFVAMSRGLFFGHYCNVVIMPLNGREWVVGSLEVDVISNTAFERVSELTTSVLRR